MLIKGRLELSDEGDATIVAQELQPLESARARSARRISLRIPEETVSAEHLDALDKLCLAEQGDIPIYFEVVTQDGLLVNLRPHHLLRVRASEKLTDAIAANCSEWTVDLIVNG